MVGIWGYDEKSDRYWYKVEVGGVEVKSDRFLTKFELVLVKESYSFLEWKKDTDFRI